MRPKTLFRAERRFDAVAAVFAFELLLDFVEQAAGVSVQIRHRDIALLEDLATLIVQVTDTTLPLRIASVISRVTPVGGEI